MIDASARREQYIFGYQRNFITNKTAEEVIGFFPWAKLHNFRIGHFGMIDPVVTSPG